MVFSQGKNNFKMIIKKIIYSLFNVITMQEKEMICILMTGYVSVLLTKMKNKTLWKKKLNTKGLQMGKELSLILLEPSISGISRRYIIAK